uniref:Uncharacterized protein n=1 Tax=Spongospora subterranea TaxID=70186 RepID=A0A0H5R0V9_9EUKA|eukprot:CRZ07825.1 hypothetical protein [Spongospora subterranea]
MVPLTPHVSPHFRSFFMIDRLDPIQVLKRFLPLAQFVSVDIEFTGLNTVHDSFPKYFDTVDLRFQQAKEVVNTFAVVQLGLCLFIDENCLDEDDGVTSNEHPATAKQTCRHSHSTNASSSLIAIPMSLLIRPSTGTFTCQASSIRFLADRGQFDFNELFRNGLPSKTVGSQVLLMLSESKVPLVMHNGLLDAMFLVRTFMEPLADSLPEFKSQCRRLLPNIYDSKLICSKSEYLRSKFASFWLEKVYEQANTDELFKDKPGIKIHESFDEKVSQHHDAAFDAYMTGVVFARLGSYIQAQNAEVAEQTDSWIVENVDWGSTKIETFANRICLNRCILHLDINSDQPACFHGVLKVCINEGTAARVFTSHIVDIIGPIINKERIKILWEDDRYAYAIIGAHLHDGLSSIAAAVNKSCIKAKSHFRVEPFQ